MLADEARVAMAMVRGRGVVVQALGHLEALALRLAWVSGTRGAVVGSEAPARTLDGA